MSHSLNKEPFDSKIIENMNFNLFCQFYPGAFFNHALWAECGLLKTDWRIIVMQAHA